MAVGVTMVRAEVSATTVILYPGTSPAWRWVSRPTALQIGRIAGDEHVIADFDRADSRWREIADVILRVEPGRTHNPAAWISRAFTHYPGCAVVATTDSSYAHWVGLRGGPVIRFVSHVSGSGIRLEAGACASLVHTWLASGLKPAMLDRAALLLTTASQSAFSQFTVSVGRRD